VVGRQNADIADTLQLRDVAMATTFWLSMVAWQRPLVATCRVSAISPFCRLTSQTLSISNHLVVDCHTKPDIAILVPNLVAMAISLRRCISTMPLSDSLTPKTYP